MAEPLDLTVSQVNRAGRTLRGLMRGDHQGRIAVDRALAVVWQYRAAHSYSLAKATMGLRSMVRTEGCAVEVSQRLKRITTIVDKLSREPTMQLANMQDVGGCRAVLESIDELRRVEHRLRRNRPPRRISDYITAPRRSGYRAVHVVVGYHDQFNAERAIEVQLRTKVMHEWAISVERLSGRLQEDLKSGAGPADLLSWLAAISEAMAMEESGAVVSDQLIAKIRQLHAKAVPYLAKEANHG